MAERFGGRYSPTPPPPDGQRKAPKRRRMSKDEWRAGFLFVVPFPFALKAFWQEPVGLATNLATFGVLLLAFWLTREGVKAHEAYEERTVARRPAFPRKLFGTVLTGLGLALGAFSPGESLFNPLLLGLLGAGLHLFAFGPDPLKDKGAEGVDAFQSDRVARAVDEAERHLADMTAAIARLKDRPLEARLSVFQGHVRDLFRTVENDPRRLTSARRYLGVYLLGARDATVKFADLYTRTPETTARADYEALLDDLEANFSARTQALLGDDRQALEIEMDVLRERLQREGLRPETPPQD